MTSEESDWVTLGHYDVHLHEPLAAATLGLSKREAEILLALIRGLNVRETAAVLNFSPHTVDVFKRRLFKKLGVRNSASAAAIGMAAFSGAALKPHNPPEEL